MSKLEKGTKVRVKSYEALKAMATKVDPDGRLSFSKGGFAPEMRVFCGKEFAIADVGKSRCTLDGTQGWFWQTEWFDVVNEGAAKMNTPRKVGDVVTIKSWAAMSKTAGYVAKYDFIGFGGSKPAFILAMQPLCGRSFTISQVSEGSPYPTYRCKDAGNDWQFIDEMFEDKVALVKEYKAGDKVKVKSLLGVSTLSGAYTEKDGAIRIPGVNDSVNPGYRFPVGMHKFCGQVVTIAEKIGKDVYDIKEDKPHSWAWARQVLEPVVDFKLHDIGARGTAFSIPAKEHSAGEKYKVINNGACYTTYSAMAKQLGATAYVERKDIEDGTVVSLIGKAPHHATPSKIVCLVEASDGKQYLIGDWGLQRLKSGAHEGIILRPDDYRDSKSFAIKLATGSSMGTTGPKFIKMREDIPNTTTPEKEKEKKKMANGTVLERLANSGLNKELEAAGVAGLPAGIREALEEQIAEENKSTAKEAAREIIVLLKSHDQHVEEKVREIRDLRARIDRKKANLEELNKAKSYGLETNNFLPLARLTDSLPYGFRPEDKALLEVPEGFTPKVAEPAKAAKTKA